MKAANPKVIPRNHLVEAVIVAARGGDFAPFHKLLAAVTAPYEAAPEYQRAPASDERVTRTFCGT